MLLDIREDHLKIVQDILRKYAPGREVWAFGSRAKWLAKEYSDLDLCILGDAPLSFRILGLLDEAFDDSNLPYKVDVVDWATTSESFRKIIERDKVVVQAGKPLEGTSDWQTVQLTDLGELNSVVGFIADSKKCDARFVDYLFRNKRYELKNEYVGTGSVQDNINLEILGQIEFNVPPLEEQHAIAHILGTLDDKIQLNRQQNETLEAMARALFKAWFVDFEPVRAKMEGRWQRGQCLPSLPAHLYDLFPDRLVESELGEIPEGWTVGNLAIAGCDMTFNQSCSAPRGKNGSGNYFVFISAQYLVEQHKSMSDGSVFSTLTRQTFEAVRAVLPPENVLQQFEKDAANLMNPIFGNVNESRSLAQLRDTLLPKLISGELRVSDADTR